MIQLNKIRLAWSVDMGKIINAYEIVAEKALAQISFGRRVCLEYLKTFLVHKSW